MPFACSASPTGNTVEACTVLKFIDELNVEKYKPINNKIRIEENKLSEVSLNSVTYSKIACIVYFRLADAKVESF